MIFCISCMSWCQHKLSGVWRYHAQSPSVMPKACDAPSGALNTTQAKRSVVESQAAEPI
ncbi:MAG: hypothetical protein J6X01_05450 [Bacteroidales bacterium]|nr:hypothetical protein [Bacteroidales bacterium]